jgi:hypothetical protein
MKSKHLIFALFATLLTIFVLALLRVDPPPVESNPEIVAGERVRAIAVCPTFYTSVDNLGDGYTVVRTESTAESLQLLDSGRVDFAIGGRMPLPEEENLEYMVLDDSERFSFLFKESVVVMEKNLRDMVVYTDQDVDLIREIFGITEVVVVEDVYEYVQEFVIITSWDNTDYSKGNIVHLLDSNGSRNYNSRIPVLFYRQEGDLEGFDLSRIDI